MGAQSGAPGGSGRKRLEGHSDDLSTFAYLVDLHIADML